ncbi:MAG: hypothetical protein KC503_17445 [Myxococcales bacterium]|nr:hypothetical protein [Myxococcales bacterium]
MANINETLAWPTVRYRGDEADGTAKTWVANYYGPDLQQTVSGPEPTYDAAMADFVAPAAIGVDYNGGRYLYAADGGADGDPAASASDVLSIIAFKFDGGTTQRFLGGKNNWTGAAPNYKGWGWWVDTGRQLKFTYYDGTVGNTLVSTSLGATPREVFACAVIDATEATAANASRIYVDGADVTSAAVSFAGIGDVSNGSNMAIGGAVGANVYTDIISFLSTHFKAGWFAGGATNNTQWDAFVASNYALVAP